MEKQCGLEEAIAYCYLVALGGVHAHPISHNFPNAGTTYAWYVISFPLVNNIHGVKPDLDVFIMKGSCTQYPSIMAAIARQIWTSQGLLELGETCGGLRVCSRGFPSIHQR